MRVSNVAARPLPGPHRRHSLEGMSVTVSSRPWPGRLYSMGEATVPIIRPRQSGDEIAFLLLQSSLAKEAAVATCEYRVAAPRNTTYRRATDASPYSRDEMTTNFEVAFARPGRRRLLQFRYIRPVTFMYSVCMRK